MKTIIYKNNRNGNKFIIVRRYADGHYVMKQYMEWSNGVRNYTGCSLKQKNGKFIRVKKSTLVDILEDYSIDKVEC